uniref:Uncharacterized protein n=1 Tax=Oryza brachyantha TaxID=4533 RepID=J3ME74_ORYBR
MGAQLEKEEKEQAVKMKGKEEEGVFSATFSPEVVAWPMVCFGAKESPKVPFFKVSQINSKYF